MHPEQLASVLYMAHPVHVGFHVSSIRMILLEEGQMLQVIPQPSSLVRYGQCFKLHII